MSIKEEVDLLRRIPLFANVEPSKLKLLAFTSERIAFEAGHILFNQGDTGDAAYIVIEGEAEVLVNGPVGPIQVAVLGRNAIVGEIAILCDVARTATVRANAPLETLRIRKDHFLKLLAEFPEMAVEIMRVLADRLSHTTAELSEARSNLRRKAN